MKPFRHLLLACLLAGLLAVPIPAPAADADPAAAVGRAQILMDSGNFAAAYTEFMDLLREYPDDVSVNVGAARSAKLAGRLNHSRILYERLVATLPENAIIRMEYAHLLLVMGYNESARQELEEAKRIDPVIVAEGESGKVFDSMKRRVSTLEYKLRLAGGMIYDSNYTTGPSIRGVKLGGIPITLDRTSTERESMGAYLHAGGDVAWRASADSSWWLVADLSGYQRWYEETTPRRDLTYGRGALGLRYLTGNVMAEVRTKVETLLENEEKSVNIYGGEGSFVYGLRPGLHGMLRAGVEHREDIGSRGRSGTYAWGGPYMRWFFGEDNHSIMAGLKGYTSATDKRRFGFSGVEPSLTFFFNLPWDTELVLAASWRNEDYNGGATIWDGQHRRDTQWRGSVFVTKKLLENLRLEVGYQYSDNHSNSELYNYDQHLITTGLAFTF